MKVGNGGAGEDLIQRMKEAHHSEVEQAPESDAPSSATATSAESVGGADESDDAKLQENLLGTASDALDGKYESSDQLRGAVVETIVDTRYGTNLSDEQRTSVVDTLKQTLVDDVEFQREVDNMLILAARELARSDS